MPPVPPRLRALRRLRLALLGAFVAVVAGLVGLYLFGRAGSELEEAATDHAGRVGEAQVTLAGQGFDYTLTQGDTPVFRIRGARIRSDREDNVELEEATVTLYRADGGVYELRGREAFYNRATQEARVGGAVRLVGPRGLELETGGLELAAEGRRLTSLAPVHFRVGEEIDGEARTLVFDFRRDLFQLRQRVRVRRQAAADEPAWSLDSHRLALDRGTNRVRADYGVELRRADDVLRATRLVAALSPDGRSVEFLRAVREVEGESHPDSGAGARFAGEELALTFGADTEPEQVELRGEPARLVLLEPGAPERTLRAPVFAGTLLAGRPVSLSAEGGVTVTEPHPAGGERTATAARARADFTSAGEMAGLALLGEVELRDPQLRASAAEARYAPGAREVELRGDRVVVVGARGELVAPRVVWDLAASVARASGGVQATLADEGGGAFAGTPLAGGEGPVRIEASEAEWREAEQTFRFHGAARAWRGEAVLIAQEISGDQRAASLAASGAVKTVWPQRSEPAAGEAGAVPPPPVQVTAERLDYARAERRLRYSGTVVVRRTELTMACAEADVELDEQERARRMTCTGGVRLDDAAAARQVTGERAEYDLATETLTVTGTPVVLVDSARGRAEGQKLVYDLGGRTVRLFATPAESGG